jgi:hypothetical protein
MIANGGRLLVCKTHPTMWKYGELSKGNAVCAAALNIIDRNLNNFIRQAFDSFAPVD